jgi:hypothetical protein
MASAPLVLPGVATSSVPASIRSSAARGAKSPRTAFVVAPRTSRVEKSSSTPDCSANCRNVVNASPAEMLKDFFASSFAAPSGKSPASKTKAMENRIRQRGRGWVVIGTSGDVYRPHN